ncbi:MAG: hypothetical protein H6Q90_4798 [Deltaproteobacteria bacterium]|nr:hypothetical protein [Deltaproteobacteria bacterium]
MRALLLLLLVAVTGCINQAANAISPQPIGSGTMTCRQIVEQCDSQCTDPLCVRRCGDEGTPEAAQQHAAVVDCAQRNGCTDEACIQSSCGAESATCQGPAPASDAAPERSDAPGATSPE